MNWAELFRELTRCEETLTPQWYMANSAVFLLTIPSFDDIGDLSFSENIGFPFEYSQIDGIEFFTKPRVGIPFVVKDPESIRQVVNRIGGFQVDESDESIVIRWPDWK